ncbi:hypothetical protein EGH90_11370 [Kaistella haifensis]|nr:hypothetical protein EGH90_11370 [Kaistella haifensis]
MKKGFSLVVSEQNVDVKSFISNDYDDFFIQTEKFVFLLEGVLLNKKKLLHEYAVKNFETLVQELFAQKKEGLIKEFEGELRGFIYDKIANSLFVFTNITSTQRVFYGKFGKQIFVDTNLVRFNATLKNAGIPSEPDLESLYQFLCFSNLPERKTPIIGISKILDAHYLEIDCNDLKISEKEYFNLSDIPTFKRNKDYAIDEMHEVFTDAILMEYQKDTELGKNHLSLLSGGLDSRVAMMYAIQNNEIPDNALCFSQSGYFDHTISEKIAEDLGIHYEFIPLDGGKFLYKIDELTEISEGMVFYIGAIHVSHAVEKMNYENFALFHSGQIGDGVLGGFNSEPRRKRPTQFKIVVNDTFLPKVQESLSKILKNYETEELFLLRNIAYNRTLLGAHVLQQKRYQTSPFMSRDFLKLAISLPEEWKFNHHFYIEWISKHCKESTKYRWERTLMKPNAKWKTAFGDQVIKRSFRILNEKILKTPQHASMYPYQYYYDSDQKMQEFYQDYFNKNLYRIERYPELWADVKMLFQSKNFHIKTQAINILSIFKLYF